MNELDIIHCRDNLYGIKEFFNVGPAGAVDIQDAVVQDEAETFGSVYERITAHLQMVAENKKASRASSLIVSPIVTDAEPFLMEPIDIELPSKGQSDKYGLISKTYDTIRTNHTTRHCDTPINAEKESDSNYDDYDSSVGKYQDKGIFKSHEPEKKKHTMTISDRIYSCENITRLKNQLMSCKDVDLHKYAEYINVDFDSDPEKISQAMEVLTALRDCHSTINPDQGDLDVTGGVFPMAVKAFGSILESQFNGKKKYLGIPLNCKGINNVFSKAVASNGPAINRYMTSVKSPLGENHIGNVFVDLLVRGGMHCITTTSATALL